MSDANGHGDSKVDHSYDGVMQVYNQLSQMKMKPQADEVMAKISSQYSEGRPAPPEVVQAGLENLLHGKSAASSGVEHTVTNNPTHKRGAAGTLFKAVATAAAVVTAAYVGVGYFSLLSI